MAAVSVSDDSAHVFLQVIGAPATIDGDLKNQFVETDVGFDTTCKVTSEISC
jgi:6-phosphofructokinase